MNGVFLLDTNTVIFFFKGNANVISAWTRCRPAEVAISSITLFELSVGATTSAKPGERRKQLQILLNSVAVLPFANHEAEHAASIKAELQRTGMQIGPLDTLIAGVALAHNLTLVTNNTAEFQRVSGLRCVDWSRA